MELVPHRFFFLETLSVNSRAGAGAVISSRCYGPSPSLDPRPAAPQVDQINVHGYSWFLDDGPRRAALRAAARRSGKVCGPSPALASPGRGTVRDRSRTAEGLGRRPWAWDPRACDAHERQSTTSDPMAQSEMSRECQQTMCRENMKKSMSIFFSGATRVTASHPRDTRKKMDKKCILVNAGFFFFLSVSAFWGDLTLRSRSEIPL